MPNLGWSGIAAVTYTLALQLLVYPVLSRQMTAPDFGNLLTSMAVVNLVGLVIGKAVSNFAMRDYAKQADVAGYRLSADVLNSCFALLSAIGAGLAIGLFVVLRVDGTALWLLAIIMLASRTHISAEYRLRLDYRRLAGSNAAIVGAYGISTYLFVSTSAIPVMAIFVLGEAAGLAWLLPGSRFAKSGLSFDRRVVHAARECAGFTVSSGAMNFLSYGDRFILPYATARDAVPAFFVASLGGRLAQTALNIVSGVILSYLARASVDRVWARTSSMLLAGVLAGIATWGALIIATPVLASLLYGQYVQAVAPIVGMVSVAFGARIAELFVRPLIIRLIPVRTIVVLDVVSAGIYAIAGLYSVWKHDLYGFAVAFAVVSVLRSGAHLAVLAPFLFGGPKGSRSDASGN